MLEENFKTTDLLNYYSTDSFLNTVLSKFKENHSIYNKNDKLDKTLYINGLSGSLLSVIILSVYKSINRSQIIIAEDEEEALYLYTDICNLLNDEKVHLFPLEIDQNKLIRNEIVNNIIFGEEENSILIAYPEAIIDKIDNPITIKNQSKILNTKDNINLTELSEWLFAQKFEKVETVISPGEFSIRGGIIDIYSYSRQEPYRIELFGNELENIKVFDPDSQLSISNVSKATLINTNENTKSNIKASLFEILPKESLLWIKKLEGIKSVFGKDENNYKDLLENIKDFEKIYLKKITSQDNSNIITYNSELQTSYNNNYEILEKDLEKYFHDNYKLIIASEHYKPAEQINTILKERNENLKLNLIKIGLYKGFIDHHLKIVCLTDHQILGRYFKTKQFKKFNSKDVLSLKHLYELKIGDYIIHIDHGIGKFGGIKKIDNNGKEQEVVRLLFKNNDLVYVNIHNLHKIVRYNGKEGANPTLNKLGSLAWDNKKKSIKKKVKDIAEDLILLYSKRKNSKGFSFQKEDTMQIAFESSFIFEDTPDQALATKDVKNDMEKPYPMDRLICGDVGFGKTEIAMRAAFKAVNNGKQVGILAPTTVLTMQHYKSFIKRFENFPITIDYINRFKTSKETSKTINETNDGKIDILIGTHALVSKKIKFKDLGLLIIDEEQKFGVSTKEQIKKIKVNIDVLTMTATPIPRTLHFSLMGARDLSIISTPPPNRQPIDTHIITFKIENIIVAINKELERNGQVFFVHNRVKNIEEIANMIKLHIPESNIGIAHGQMEGKNLENQMIMFIEGKYDILVSTNIIESGLDIPNANTIIINDAHKFGLSDLHQMRGRVGRSNKKAYCYLISPPLDLMTSDARKRINALEEFSNIGDGFKVAMKDLDIRGAGNLLGGEQSGFIGDIGFEMYHKILDEAVEELKETKFKGLFEDNTKAFEKDCLIETDLQILIPEDYVKSQTDRINLYMKIDKLKNQKELEEMKMSLIDRYGKIPLSFLKLFEVVKLRWLAKKMKIDKLKLKNDNLTLYLNKKNNFKDLGIIDKVLSEIQNTPNLYSLKETDNELKITIKNIDNIDNAFNCMKNLNSK
ncbi:MAG: transcription-repair coupling factor [Bacteroidetes bacterium]|nr:transcription-repair coupling factor [Bacteroidota bacterium]